MENPCRSGQLEGSWGVEQVLPQAAVEASTWPLYLILQSPQGAEGEIRPCPWSGGLAGPLYSQVGLFVVPEQNPQ